MRAHRLHLLSRLISVQHPSLGAGSELRKILISTFEKSMTLWMACLSPCHFARSLRGCIRAVVLPKESLASIVLRTTETCPKTALGTTVGSNFLPMDYEMFFKSVKTGQVPMTSWTLCSLTSSTSIVNEETEEGIVYDPAAFWAHNEYGLGNWRPARNQFTRLYFDEYHSHVPKAEPAEDYNDRNALYALRFDLHAAALFSTQEEYVPMYVSSSEATKGKPADSHNRAIDEITKGTE
ncbi:uncharacterized protein QC761_0029200 [Podospora bellae-mahoneyi]|uniref:Uncharacterized protein n=1 Tax=Podospora bellae-mahoneyi TaxID=2093777 RepID=A0ABR0FT93_9PEZI|nr:hypothetical protein QC761_0029200 [Podospora bellae-mahoneyi]